MIINTGTLTKYTDGERTVVCIARRVCGSVRDNVVSYPQHSARIDVGGQTKLPAVVRRDGEAPGHVATVRAGVDHKLLV